MYLFSHCETKLIINPNKNLMGFTRMRERIIDFF